MKLFWCLFLLISVHNGVSSQPVSKIMQMGRNPDVRVLLLKSNRPETILLPAGSEVKTGIETRTVNPATECKILPQAGQFVFTAGAFSVTIPDSLIILVPGQEGLKVNGEWYRGNLLLFPDAGSSVLLVNSVSLENYLQSVIPAEIGQGRKKPDLEAVKVQSIAARTFTYSKLLSKRQGDNRYDLLPTVMDQAYFGIKSENNAYRLAISETKGMVGVYGNELIEALYHSTCGGLTENSEDVWGGKTVPYLRSVYCGDDTSAFCSSSPFYYWERHVEMKTFWPVFHRQLVKVSDRETPVSGWKDQYLKNFGITGRDSSGRVTGIHLETETGNSAELKGDYSRWLFPDSTGKILPSVWFDFTTEKQGSVISSLHFKGKGYGHGVGICQWGAVGMSRRGYTFDQIFRFYYRGARIVKVY